MSLSARLEYHVEEIWEGMKVMWLLLAESSNIFEILKIIMDIPVSDLEESMPVGALEKGIGQN